MLKPPLMSDEADRQGAQLEVDAALAEDICALVRTGEQGMVLNLLADLYPADLARLLAHLPESEALTLFGWLPEEEASDVLPELETGVRNALLETMHTAQITALIDELDTDDAADVLADLPDELAERVLPGLVDAEDVRELLSYGEETAGGIMGTEFVAVPAHWTVAEATEEVRRHAEVVEPIYAVYVVDDQERFKGLVSLKGLLLSPANLPIHQVMEPDVPTVEPEVDQEEVARIMERYDLVALPVVDADGHLIGRITIDDVVDVIREEHQEDIQLMSGITSGDEELRSSVVKISRGRLPWLLIGLAGATLSGFVIKGFEEGLAQAVILATFIPIVTAMGGNAAIQSAAIAVQGLSSGSLWTSDILKRLGKEIAVALLNGVALSILVALMVLVFGLGGQRLAFTVGLTLFTVILLATTNGALMPILLHRIGVDPSISMGPFVTTMNDIIGLSVYFLIATLLYL